MRKLPESRPADDARTCVGQASTLGCRSTCGFEGHWRPAGVERGRLLTPAMVWLPACCGLRPAVARKLWPGRQSALQRRARSDAPYRPGGTRVVSTRSTPECCRPADLPAIGAPQACNKGVSRFQRWFCYQRAAGWDNPRSEKWACENFEAVPHKVDFYLTTCGHFRGYGISPAALSSKTRHEAEVFQMETGATPVLRLWFENSFWRGAGWIRLTA